MERVIAIMARRKKKLLPNLSAISGTLKDLLRKNGK